MLTVTDLRRDGLQPTSLELTDGEGLAIEGASGSGKTLLLRAIADLDPSTGRVVAAPLDRARVPAPAWRRHVAYVPAESGWWADRVGDHLHRATAADLLARLGLPDDAPDWSVSRLSSGERHRLALVRALTLAPRVLLLDEPTATLDPAATALVEAELIARLADGVTLVLVTHDPGQAARLGLPVWRMAAGRLLPAGGTENAG